MDEMIETNLRYAAFSCRLGSMEHSRGVTEELRTRNDQSDVEEVSDDQWALR